MLKELRPVGNHVALKSSPLKMTEFQAFKIHHFASGTQALAAAMEAVKAQYPDVKKPEILIPAYTCPDVISAAIYAKITPILVDFEKDSSWLSLEDLNSKITSNSIATLAINFLGIRERIHELRNITSKHNMMIIEDSAQGFPIESPEEYWQGDIIITSYGRGKPINLLGGGSVFTKNINLANSLPDIKDEPESTISHLIYWTKARIVNLLLKPRIYYWLTKIPSLNLGATIYHPLETLSAMPNTIKNYFEINYQNYQNRKQKIKKLNDFFENIPEVIPLIKLCNQPEDHIYLRYPILIKDKPEVVAELLQSKLGISQMYKTILPNIQKVPLQINDIKRLNNANKFSQQLLTLPTHEDTDINEIIKIFDKTLNNA